MGANHAYIPINRELKKYLNERDGLLGAEGNFGNSPNYYPNSYFLDRPDLYGIASSPFAFSMDDIAFIMSDSLEQQYQHARESYRALTRDERHRLHQNLAYALSDITKSNILDRVFFRLHQISHVYAEGVKGELDRLEMK